MLFHQRIQVVHLLAEALALRRHLADDGTDFAQDIGPAEPRGQHDPGAHHAFQDVARPEVTVAHLGWPRWASKWTNRFPDSQKIDENELKQSQAADVIV